VALAKQAVQREALKVKLGHVAIHSYEAYIVDIQKRYPKKWTSGFLNHLMTKPLVLYY